MGRWGLHLLPGASASSNAPSKGGASSRLHYLGIRVHDGQQLVQLKQLVVQALVENARRLG